MTSDACGCSTVARRSIFLAPVGLAIVVGLAFQGTRGLYESSEARYAECARELLASGKWLEPTLRGKPHWTKPPLTYWAIAGGIKVLGRNEWGVRLYGAAAFILTVGVITLLGRAMWDNRTGLIAGLIGATAPFLVGGGNVATTDILLTLWETLAVLCYWRARRAATPRRAGGWVVAFWAALGLGFMTKGLPALLPLVAIIPFHLWMRRRGHRGPRLLSVVGIALFVAIGLWWYAVVVLRNPDLVDYFLGNEVVGRLATNRFDRNPEWHKPFLLYLPPLLLGLGIWVGTWPGLVRRLGGTIRRTGLKTWLAQHPQAVFLLLWLWLPLAVFWIVPSRLPLYVLPLLPALVLMTAQWLSVRYAGPGLGRTVWTLTLISAVLAIAGKGILAYIPNAHDSRPLAMAMLAEGGPGSQFAVINRVERFGLDFYLDGRVTRIASRQPKGDVFDNDVAGFIETLNSRVAGPAWVIAFKSDAAELMADLDKAGISFRRAPGCGRYGILVVPAARDAHRSEQQD